MFFPVDNEVVNKSILKHFKTNHTINRKIA